MREFKFKAWIEETETMIKEASLQHMIWQKVSTFPIKYLREKIIFLQYTGLKDKNGIEIYEGDVLGSGTEYMEVAFRDGSFIVIHDPSCRAEFEGECKTDILDKECVDIYKFELVGNIYENKELLEVGK